MKTISKPVRVLLFFSLLLLTGNRLHAQPDLNFTCQVNRISSINPVNNFDTLYDWRCILSLQDTAGIDSIHVKMGYALGSDSLLHQAFKFDSQTGLSGDLLYRRDSNLVTLCLGNYLLRTYFIEVQLEDTLSNLSTIRKWNNQ